MIDASKRMLRRSLFGGPAADLHGLLRRPEATLRLWRDAWRTWEEVAFTREIQPADTHAPTLLILSMTDVPYNAKMEAMLGFAVKRRGGWNVRVLTSRAYPNARRIFRSHGIKEHVFFDDVDWEEAASTRTIAAEVEKRATELMTFQSVLKWTYRDSWIGPQLLSSLSRKTFNGAPNPQSPQVQSMLLKQLSVAMKFVHAAERELTERRPAAILVNEPNYYVLGPFVDVAIAKGIPVIHYIQPSREDALVFKKLTRDTRRIHPNSITSATFEALLAEPWGEREEKELEEEFESRYSGIWKVQSRNQPSTRELTPSEVRGALNLPPDRPIAAVFSHVLWDANLFYGEDLFENYGEWFVETVRAASENSRMSWIIKLHPANLWKRKLSGVTDEYGELRLIREQIGELPCHVRLLLPDTPVSTLSLFHTINLGVTVRGSVGYELPCFGVPVVTAGTGRYSNFGFTMDHTERAGYLATLAQAEKIPRLSREATHRARVHAHALFRRRPWFYKSFRSEIGEDVTDPLFQNLHPAISPHGKAYQMLDLDCFSDWLMCPSDIDYLEPSLGKHEGY